jgi:hypothetical protein
MGHCWGHLPTPSVFDLSSLRWDRRFELYEQGFESIEQVPAEAALDETTQLIVERHRRGEAWVDREAIQTFLDGLHYPLCFLDFETINPAVPPYDGLRPYGQLPFLYSVYRQEGPSREPEHRGFLAEAGADPRRELAGRLLEDLGESGNVLVYGQSFEGTRLRELAEQVPDWAGGLEAIQPRLRDLMGIFRQRQYYHPAMHGSYSIKAVLPALVPELGYGDLAIADGTAAMRAYSELEGEVDAGRAETLRKDLWDYCQRDTLAMVRVVEALRALVA